MRKIACAFAVAAVLVGSVFAYEQTTYDYYVNDGIIRDVLRTTARKVYDRDGDGEVNCIDYTLTFKKEWNKSMPPAQCEIMRNYRPTRIKSAGMNHLFVRVKMTSGGKWLYIEPQASYTGYNYKMSDFWDWKYDPNYNCYGETFYWLGECKR